MQAQVEMQPEDIHGTRTTEQTVMQSVDRTIEIVREYMLNDYMESNAAQISIGWLQKAETYLLNSQEFECLQYVRKKLTPEAWEKFERVVIKQINANTHEPDHEHIENNRPITDLNMNNIYTDKPLFEDPSSLKHVRNSEHYEVEKHLLMVYMALKKVCTGPVLEDRLEYFIATINYLLEANVCNLGWRNALYMLLNGVFPNIDIIPDMDQFMLNAMLDTISSLIDDYVQKNASSFMRVFVGEVAQQRDPGFACFIKQPCGMKGTLFTDTMFSKLRKFGVNPDDYKVKIKWLLPELYHTFNDYSSHTQQWLRELSRIFKVRAYENETKLIAAIQVNLQNHFVNTPENINNITQLGKILDSYFVYQECKYLVSHWCIHNLAETTDSEILLKTDIATLDLAFLNYIKSWQSNHRLGDNASGTLLNLVEKFDRVFYRYSLGARSVNKFFEEWHRGINIEEMLKKLHEDSLKPNWFVDDFMLQSILPVIRLSDQTYQQKLITWCKESRHEYLDLFLRDRESVNLLGKPLVLDILLKIEKEAIFKNNNKLILKWIQILNLPKFRMLLNDSGFLNILEKNLFPLLGHEKFLDLLKNTDFLEVLFYKNVKQFLFNCEWIVRMALEEMLELLNLICQFKQLPLLRSEPFLELLLDYEFWQFLKCTNFLEIVKNERSWNEYFQQKLIKLKPEIKATIQKLKPGIDLNKEMVAEVGRDPGFWPGIVVLKEPEMITVPHEVIYGDINLSYDIINRIFLHAVTEHPVKWSEKFYSSLSFIYDLCKNDFSNPDCNIKRSFHQKPYQNPALLNQIKYLLDTWFLKNILCHENVIALNKIELSEPEFPVISIPMQTDYKNYFNNFIVLLPITSPAEQFELVKNQFDLINNIQQFEQVLSCIFTDWHQDILSLFDEKLKEKEFLGGNYVSIVRCFAFLDKICVTSFRKITLSHIENMSDLINFLQLLEIENQDDFIPFINTCFSLFEIKNLSVLRKLFAVLDYDVQNKLLDIMSIEKLAIICVNIDMLELFMEDLSDDSKQTVLNKLGKLFIESLYTEKKLRALLDFWNCKLDPENTPENQQALAILHASKKRKAESEEFDEAEFREWEEPAFKKQKLEIFDEQGSDFENQDDGMNFEYEGLNTHSIFNTKSVPESPDDILDPTFNAQK